MTIIKQTEWLMTPPSGNYNAVLRSVTFLYNVFDQGSLSPIVFDKVRL